MKVQELLTEESKWTQGAIARDEFTHALDDEHDEEACQWCLIGGIYYCYNNNDQMFEIIEKVQSFLQLEAQWDNDTLVLWNDAPERTFAEVREVIETLDI